ncbi:MauE/DoxX family redox-associated membrane protein [Nonomuraea sp. B5E05]|uniref:MauE/DoxX family redox-associated membrane protein n=1 Tax=Nonomuraea sp. B5E05 TaxID=3153569 RepID=UPI003260C3DE
MQYVALGMRCAIGLVFLVAVLGKVRSKDAFGRFAGSVPDLLPRLPPRATVAVGAAVVAAEASVVVLLVAEGTAPAGLVLAGAVLLAFCAAIGRVIRTGARTPCRCFGATASPLGGRHLIRNVLLVLAAAAGVAAHQEAQPAGLHPAGVVIALVAGAAAALAVVLLDDLVDLFAGRPAVHTRGSRPS